MLASVTHLMSERLENLLVVLKLRKTWLKWLRKTTT